MGSGKARGLWPAGTVQASWAPEGRWLLDFLPLASRSQQDGSGVVYGPNGPSDDCDNVGPRTGHRALWARRGPFPGSVAEGAQARASRDRPGCDTARSTGSHATWETASSWVWLRPNGSLPAEGDGDSTDPVCPVTPHGAVVSPLLFHQTLSPGVRDSGRHFALLFIDKRGRVRTSVSWRQAGPHRSPPCCPWPAGPSWLSDRHRWLDVCFSRLGRGAAPGDPVPNPLSSRGHQVLVRALRGGLA